MADKSKIEWTDATWNPIRARNLKTGKVGWHCEHATTGCEFCYAESFNKRLGTGLAFKPGHRKDIEIFLCEETLLAPLRWKRPRMIFPGSMTDLFAEFVRDEWLDRIFAVMALTPHHTYQVLTKRAGRMREYLSNPQTPDRQAVVNAGMIAGFSVKGCKRLGVSWNKLKPWPLSNVWLGVSTERQPEADERIPELLRTPAAVRFISYEPALGSLDLEQIEAPDKVEGERWTFNCLQTGDYYHQHDDLGHTSGGDGPYRESAIDWVIAGGESGRNARPMHPDWARSLRDQCAAADVAFFFKQWGEWAPSTPEAARGNPRSGWRCVAGHPHVAKAAELYPEAGAVFIEHMGKKAAGRLLDGIEHNGMPAAIKTGAAA